MNEPELLETGPGRGRPTRLRAVLLAAAAVAAAGIVMVRSHDSPARIPAPSRSPSPAPIAAPTGALLVRYGTEVDRIPLAGGPWRQVSVPAAVGGDAFLTPDGTTLVQSDGRRLLLVPLRPLRPALAAAPAVAVLPGIDLPPHVWLLNDHGRLESYDPLRRRTGAVLQVPAGWRVRAVIGSAGEVVTRPTGRGSERIGLVASGPGAGGPDSTVTDVVVGHYLGASRSGIVWLDPACPKQVLPGPPCRLHVGSAALEAPPGVTFVPGSVTISGGADLLVPARTLGGFAGADDLLVRIFGQNASGFGFGVPQVVPGSRGIRLSSGIVFLGSSPIFLRASEDGISYSFLATPGGGPPPGWAIGRTLPGAPQLLGLDQSGGG